VGVEVQDTLDPGLMVGGVVTVAVVVEGCCYHCCFRCNVV
jgi:hypothetical protein